MGSFKTFAAAGVMSLAFAVTGALAADLPSQQPMMPIAPVPVVDVGGGWYLRGDVGVGSTRLGSFNGVDLDSSLPPPDTGYVPYQVSIGDQFFAGVGVGYQFNNWIRADFTGEYRTGGNIRTIEGYGYGVSTPNSFNVVNANLNSWVGLANVYFDLGQWWGLTPFIGAGVGFADHRLSGVYDSGFGNAAGGIGWAREKSTSDLAWAVHAGLAYSVTPNVKLELAYRYLNMGNAQTGAVVCAGGPPCPVSVYNYKHLESHDIKLGMRWALGGSSAPMPAPISARY